MNAARQFLVLSVIAGALAACDREAPGTTGDAPGATTAVAPAGNQLPPLEPPMATSREFGHYALHFNALRTSELTPEVAKTYGIVRSPNRVLVTLSMVEKVEGAPDRPVSGQVDATAVNLNGQFKNLTLRELRDGESIYYIGDVPVTSQETLVFTVEATPADSDERMAVRFQREFP